MSLAQKIMIAAAATIAGCATGPEWNEPQPNQKPLMARTEEKAPEQKQTPASPFVKTVEYSELALEVRYSFENMLAASGFESYVSLIEKTEKKQLTGYERLELAVFQIGKGKTELKTKDISDAIASYTKAKGMTSVKLPRVALEEGDTERLYVNDVVVDSAQVQTEFSKLTDDKSDAEKAKVAKALRAVYDGKTPMNMKQVAQVKAYLK